jgi:hypothetical protein
VLELLSKKAFFDGMVCVPLSDRNITSDIMF